MRLCKDAMFIWQCLNPPKTPLWYFLCWSRAPCVFVRHDFAIYKVCGRFLTVTSLLLALFEICKLAFFLGMNTSSKGICIFLHVDTCIGKTSSSELFGAWLVTQIFMIVVLGKGMCAYIGSVIYSTMNFVLLWAAVTPLCLVVATNMWLGEQKHSTACCNGRPRWMSFEADFPRFCFHLLQFIQYYFGYAIKNSIKTISPKITPECTETALWTVTACFVSSPPQQL